MKATFDWKVIPENSMLFIRPDKDLDRVDFDAFVRALEPVVEEAKPRGVFIVVLHPGIDLVVMSDWDLAGMGLKRLDR